MTTPNLDKNRSGSGSTGSSDARGRDGMHGDHAQMREHHLDKTIEDSFPASDPPSTDPNPDGDD